MENDTADNCAANKSVVSDTKTGGFKFKMPLDVNSLKAVREPIAESQEVKPGIPKNESLSFTILMKTLAQESYNVVIALIAMFCSFIPMFDTFLLCVRFVLDKLIEICESQETGDKAIKGLIFLVELTVLGFVIVMMFTLIIWPICQLYSSFTLKVWHVFYN